MTSAKHSHDGDQWAIAIEILTEFAEMVRGAINSASAGTVTEDAGMDMGHAVLELLALYYQYELDHILVDLAPAAGAGWVLGQASVKRCFSIVFWLLVLFTALEYLDGNEAPDDGSDFAKGQSKLDDIYETLLGAKATDWQGQGARVYNAKNEALYGLVATMRDADRQIAHIVRRQAEKVQELREEIASILAALVVLLLAIALYMKLYWIPNSGAGTGQSCADPACVRPECEEEARVAYFQQLTGEFCGISAPVLNTTQITEAAATTVNSAPPPWLDSPTNWLPPLVAGVAIMATAAAIVCVGLVIDEGRSNAKEIEKQRDIYRQAAKGAADIVHNLGAVAPVIGGPAISEASSTTGFSTMPMMADAADKRAPVWALTGTGAGGANGSLAGSRSEPQWQPFAVPTLVGLGQPAGGASPRSMATDSRPRAEETASLPEDAVPAEPAQAAGAESTGALSEMAPTGTAAPASWDEALQAAL